MGGTHQMVYNAKYKKRKIMTKKHKIIELFDSMEWYESTSGKLIKIITYDDFNDAGLYGDIENSQQHCDVIYARRIIQGLGHRVIVGSAMHIWKDKLK